MPEDSKHVTVHSIWRFVIGSMITAILTATALTYQSVIKNTQAITDHNNVHLLESVHCSEYRITVRRELDRLWDECNKGGDSKIDLRVF